MNKYKKLFSEENDTYNIEMFTFESTPKDYSNQLEFNLKEHTASFKIYGYVPQLGNVYKMADNPQQIFFNSTPLIVCVALEIISVAFFIIIFLYIKERKKRIRFSY